MIIIGAGYAGLLAGCINKDAVIFESNSLEKCSRKHQAVFRMKTDKIGQYLGIPFKKVKVFKSIWYCEKNVDPTPDMIHMYSKKVSDTISNRSISNIGTEIRYIPPKNFYGQLVTKSCETAFNSPITQFSGTKEEIVISTVPLMVVLRQKNIQATVFGSTNFQHNPIYVTKLKINDCDSYATIYYPNPMIKIYRSTLNGDELIIESMQPLIEGDMEFGIVLNSMGLQDEDIDSEIFINHEQPFGKITEIDNYIRSNLIFSLTIKHNIYSLGRYATWRPKLMLDDVFDDIFVIRRLIEQGSYAANLYRQEEK